MKKEDKILIIGIGNSGRQDDGLGWKLLDFLNVQTLENIELIYKYQLQIEDADLISSYDRVIIVDAVKHKVDNGFYFKECKPSSKFNFTTHELDPETILFLANNLYFKYPHVFILGIEGIKWNLRIGLSEEANINLEKAKDFLIEKIVEPYNVESF